MKKPDVRVVGEGAALGLKGLHIWLDLEEWTRLVVHVQPKRPKKFWGDPRPRWGWRMVGAPEWFHVSKRDRKK